LKSSQFGSKCELSEKFLKDILKSGIAEMVIDQAKLKELSKMAKTMGGGKKSRLLGIKKLEDANDAGTRNAESCTLIITEGDSAKALAMAGIEIVGRDKFGVFPLRGKMLNVREASVKSILANEEIQNLVKILGKPIWFVDVEKMN
jgi:DNA topoisomerase II